MFRADLHCHSYYSDGSLSPKELIDLAQKEELHGLAITDHDTVKGVLEGLAYAREKSIRFISGVEFSSYYREVPVHVLGYSFHPSHPAILASSQHNREIRFQRNQTILKELNKKGILLSWEDITHHMRQAYSIGRPHIAMEMVRKNYVKDFKEAFEVYLKEGALCFVPANYPSVSTTIDTIHQAGGIAILAHPHLIKKKSIIEELLEMKWDGLEGFCSPIKGKGGSYWQKKAHEKNWLVTGGSDFHVIENTYSSLGSAWTQEDIFIQLEKRFLHNMEIDYELL